MAGFCEQGNEPLVSIKKTGYSFKSSATIDFSKNTLHHGWSSSSSKTVKVKGKVPVLK
jgi:hypothetical protein